MGNEQEHGDTPALSQEQEAMPDSLGSVEGEEVPTFVGMSDELLVGEVERIGRKEGSKSHEEIRLLNALEAELKARAAAQS